jgi:hypothetical protein
VADTALPVITLQGDDPVTLEVGTAYSEPGYEATDNYDGDITANVTVTGTVDHTVAGTYVLHCGDGDDAAAVAALDVPPGDADENRTDLDSGRKLRFVHGSPNGIHSALNVDDDALTESLRWGAAKTKNPQLAPFHPLRYNGTDFRRPYIKPYDNVVSFRHRSESFLTLSNASQRTVSLGETPHRGARQKRTGTFS